MGNENMYDLLVIAPFRRPTFRFAIAADYPLQEPWDSPPFQVAGAGESAGLRTLYLPLLNVFPGYCDSRHRDQLHQLLAVHPARLVIFAADNFVASRSTAAVYGIQIAGRMLCEQTPRPLIGVCGRLATVLGQRLFELCTDLDFIVVGEAEAVLADVLPFLLRHELSKLEDHPSVLLRRDERHPKRIEPAYIEDPDSLPQPAYHLAGQAFSVYEQVTGRSAVDLPFSIRTSYGCRFHCRFCGGIPHWRDYRTKSPVRVGLELDLLETHVGKAGRVSFLEDELFTLLPDHWMAICELLRCRGLLLDGLYTHARFLSPEAATALASVVRRVHLGLDSADDRVLSNMGKGQTFSRVLEAVGIADRVGLKVQLEWIIGAPAETRDNLIQSLSMIYNLLVTNSVDAIETYVYCPHPGTEYAENCNAYDLQIIGDLEDIEESGGFPVARTSALSCNEVFVAYLISQIVIQEATTARTVGGPAKFLSPPNYPALHRLFASIAGDPKPDRVDQSKTKDASS